MHSSKRGALKRALYVTSTLSSTILGVSAAYAADAASPDTIETVIVTSERTTRSAVQLSGIQAQRVLPGISPLKAIQTLPGVAYETADPWGNNEQNESLLVHGFTQQQLGFTMDGVPLGDQQYGNYNGLSPSRAVTSENVDHVTLSSGAGQLGIASTSNLGGAIETFSSDPLDTMGLDVRETLGSFYTTRTFARLDTGDLGDGNAGYVSYLHHDARAWDFEGHQMDDQANLKFVHEDSTGRLTFFADYDYKVEPNEDATAFGNQQTAAAASFTPYTRPFLFPNLAAAIANLTHGTPPASQGNNFSNYDSAAQREDVLTYLQYDWNIDSDMTWSNQVYYHHDTGRGIVAGPINQAGLPGLFGIYFPALVVGGSPTTTASLDNIVAVFGGTGYEVRTTEYRINRTGIRSTFDWQWGDHEIEAGVWYERNASGTGRRWYPFAAANDDLTPYDVPRNPAFTQYDVRLKTDDVQLHIQDQWRVFPALLLQAGIKASLQTAGNKVLTQQQNLLAGNPFGLPATNPPVQFPTGSITSNNWFLPQVGAIWDATEHEQVFVNVQKNMRQFIPYAAGSNFYGASPWSLGSQLAFDTFKATAHPETAWEYEAGIRTRRDVDFWWLSGIEGQANYYHVNFSNRLFNVATYNFINPNPAILVNVGGVTTDGIDVAATLHFGDHWQVYDAVSYNNSTYDSNFTTVSGGVSTVVPIAGKQVPLQPNWLNKFVLSTNWDDFEAQLVGDLVGRRFTSYLNDQKVASTFELGFGASYTVDLPQNQYLHRLKIAVNANNLTDTTGVSTAVVTGASGGYQAFPLPPRMGFVTLSTNF
ncbi:MAG: TonB-dependent receptor [Alphaproteobacteria bacterium]|nr:TonB-dependent receptor [Alphaproteobacteria bacterium]MBL7096459.1 TonB-dependent receptor [Alphaproteobacteria bacterium]